MSAPQPLSRWKCIRNWDSSTNSRECHSVALLAVTQNVSQWENENYSTLPAFYFNKAFIFQTDLTDLQSPSEVCTTNNCEICRQPELTTAPWICIASIGTWWQKVLQGIPSCLNTSQMWLTHPNPDPALKVNPSITGSALCEWGRWCRDRVSSDVGEVTAVWWSAQCGHGQWYVGVAGELLEAQPQGPMGHTWWGPLKEDIDQVICQLIMNIMWRHCHLSPDSLWGDKNETKAHWN